MSPFSEPESSRRRVYLIVEHGASLGVAPHVFRFASILAVVLSIAGAIGVTSNDLPASWRLTLSDSEVVFTIFFALEYAARLWVAPEHPVYTGAGPFAARMRSAKTPIMILDALGILPYLILVAVPRVGGLAMLLQVLRFLRLGRYSPALAGVGRVFAAEWRPLAAAGMLGIGILLFSSTAMYLAERAAQPAKFSSIPAAMYWGIVTLATVGYGDMVPITPIGKIIAGIAILCGLILFALPIAIIATGFLNEIRRRDFMVTYGMVSRVPLFAGLGGAALAELVSMLKSRRVPRGVEVVRKNEAGDCMYFIASGEVEVALPDQRIRLSEGDFFGEMAVLGKTPRSATVVSTRNCELLLLDAVDVMKFMEQNPHLATPLREAAERRTR